MSTQNPLNEFNSYSYHHFLIIADSSASAAKISDNPEEFFQFVRSGSEIEGLSVLINPLSSNNLIIQDISWTTVMNGDSGTSTSTNSATGFSEGKMTIVEPNGVRFFNRIYDTYRKFNISGGGLTAVWVLKTIFIGYRDAPFDGQPDYISNIKPMTIFPTNFAASFTEGGGVYDLEFVDATNGAGGTRISNSTAVTTGGTVNLGGETGTTDTVTLEAAMANFQTRIEDVYNQNFEKVSKQQANAKISKLAQAQPEKMQYRITLCDMLKDSTFVLDVPPQQSVGGNGKVPAFAMGVGERLDQALTRIIMMCPKVMALAREGDANGDRWMHLVHTWTESLDPEQNNGVRTRNNFYVYMRKFVTQFDPSAGAQKTEEVKTAQGTTTSVEEGNNTSNTTPEATAVKQGAIDANNFLEFDYTFTGKNVDVLTYDMRMNMAVGLFQSLISPSAVPNTGQIPATENAQTASNHNTLGNGAPGPVVNPQVANSAESLHSTNPQGVSFYQDLFKRWVNVETVAVQMKIRGNPLLLDSLVLTKADLDRALTNPSGQNGLAGNWLNGPIVVKVNVRMPVDDEPGVYESFWYDGFYRVLTCQTTFSGGDFTQDLELLAMSDGAYNAVDDSTAQRPRGPGPSSEDLSAALAAPEPTGDRKAINTLQISVNGLNLIKKFESFAAKKYLDNDKYAIGYGHNFTDEEARSGIIYLSNSQVIINNGITMEQADELLRRDVNKIAEGPIHNKVSVPMYQNEYDVLCSMVYNLGSGKILGPDSTLLKVLNRQQYTQVPEQIMVWNKWRRGGVLVVNPGVDARRKQEAAYWGTAA